MSTISRWFIFMTNWIPVRFVRYHAYRIDQFVRRVAAEYDRPGQRLIDIGAQNSPYRTSFHQVEYVSQDTYQNQDGTVQVIGDVVEGLPGVLPDSFDYILCTQVLEHLTRPEQAFREFYRILKPGGKMFLTTHQSFEEHMAPHDYFRFTRYGLEYLGEVTGFTVDRITPHGGVFHVLAHVLTTWPIKVWFKKINYGYYLYLTLTAPLIFFIHIICDLLDRLDRDKSMTLNYECVYTKPISGYHR